MPLAMLDHGTYCFEMAKMALLFDLDGTLSDSKPGVVQCIRFTLGELGMSVPSPSELGWCLGPPLHHSFQRLLGHADSAHPQVKEAVAIYRERYASHGMFEAELFKGIRESVENLHASADLFVATSKLDLFAVQMLRHFGIDHHFRAIHGSAADGRLSDKGELIAHILRTERLDPASVAMIGDREHDMIGASKNSIPGYGVAWGYGTRAELEESGAVRVFKDPAELGEYFEALTAAR